MHASAPASPEVGARRRLYLQGSGPLQPPIDTGYEAAGFCIAQMRIFHLWHLENSLHDGLEVRRADPSLGQERSSAPIALERERKGAKRLG